MNNCIFVERPNLRAAEAYLIIGHRLLFITFLQVNGVDIEECKSKEAARILASCGDVVQLKLIRYHNNSSRFNNLEMLGTYNN